MPVTSFTKDQCKQLNTIMDEVMLNKYQLNRKMPNAVVYSPYNKGGMNYPSFLVIQDQMRIMNLLKQLRWNKTVANDFLVTLSAVQFTSGLCEPIFMETSTDLSYVPQGWILHLRSRFNEWGGQMWIEHQWTPDLQRIHDSSLMKAFSELPGATKQKLEKCNMCRLYSRVITVSDISDERGTHIPWKKISGDWKANSTLQLWPTMPKPPSKYWST